MIEFTRARGKHRGTYKAYTEDEAKELGIKYKYWKDLEKTDVGEYWGMTDDGYIGEVLDVKHYSNKRGYVKKTVKMVTGTAWVVPNATIKLEKNIQNRCFSQMNPLKYRDRILKEGKTKRFVKLVAHLRVKGNWPLTQEQLEMLGTVYNAKEAMPIVKAKYLLKHKGVQKLVDEEIKNILTSKGLDRSWTIDKAKAIVEGAIETGQFKDADKALEKFERWNSMLDKKMEQTQTIEAIGMQQIGELISGQKLKLQQQQKGVIDEGRSESNRVTEEVKRGFGDSSTVSERSSDEE